MNRQPLTIDPKNALYHNRTLAVTEAYGTILAFVFN
jgi:hypothetical protein